MSFNIIQVRKLCIVSLISVGHLFQSLASQCNAANAFGSQYVAKSLETSNFAGTKRIKKYSKSGNNEVVNQPQVLSYTDTPYIHEIYKVFGRSRKCYHLNTLSLHTFRDCSQNQFSTSELTALKFIYTYLCKSNIDFVIALVPSSALRTNLYLNSLHSLMQKMPNLAKANVI